MTELRWWQIEPTDRFVRVSEGPIGLPGGYDAFEFPNNAAWAVFVGDKHVATIPYGMLGTIMSIDDYRIPEEHPCRLTWDEVQP